MSKSNMANSKGVKLIDTAEMVLVRLQVKPMGDRALHRKLGCHVIPKQT